MGNTPYYRIPYPESTDAPDGPTQMRATADAIETLLKNGFIMPTGDLKIGDITDTALRLLHLQKTDAGVQFDSRLYVPSGGGLLLEVLKAGVQTTAMQLAAGQVNVYSGGKARPIPFAMTTAFGSIGPAGSTVGWDVGYFTRNPIVLCGTSGTQTYHMWCTASSTTGATMWQNSGANLNAFIMAIQMTPTVALREAPEPTKPDGWITRAAVCHTEGCPNADHTLLLDSPSEETSCWCGPCGVPYTDLTLV